MIEAKKILNALFVKNRDSKKKFEKASTCRMLKHCKYVKIIIMLKGQ